MEKNVRRFACQSPLTGIGLVLLLLGVALAQDIERTVIVNGFDFSTFPDAELSAFDSQESQYLANHEARTSKFTFSHLGDRDYTLSLTIPGIFSQDLGAISCHQNQLAEITLEVPPPPPELPPSLVIDSAALDEPFASVRHFVARQPATRVIREM